MPMAESQKPLLKRNSNFGGSKLQRETALREFSHRAVSLCNWLSTITFPFEGGAVPLHIDVIYLTGLYLCSGGK